MPLLNKGFATTSILSKEDVWTFNQKGCKVLCHRSLRLVLPASQPNPPPPRRPHSCPVKNCSFHEVTMATQSYEMTS